MSRPHRANALRRAPGGAKASLTLTAAALGLAAIAALNTWAAFVASQPPPVAAVLAKAGHTSAVAELRGLIMRDGTAVITAPGPATERQIRFLNLRLPLSPLPYVASANAALAQGDTDRAIALLEAARTQDPRSQSVRITLAQLYLQNRKVDAAAREIYAAAELDRADSRLIMAAIRAASFDPSFAAAVHKLVEERPARAQAMYRMIRYGDDLGDPVVLDLIRRVPPTGANLKRILPMLINNGRTAEALAVYRASNGLAPGAPIAWPQDPGFDQPLASGAFSWADRSGQRARADLVADDGWNDPSVLSVSFTGAGKEAIVEQRIMAPAGPASWTIPYRKADWQSDGSQLVWQIACLRGAVLAQAALDSASPETGALRLSATIPAGCPTQSLTLRGEGASRQASMQALFRAVTPSAGAER